MDLVAHSWPQWPHLTSVVSRSTITYLLTYLQRYRYKDMSRVAERGEKEVQDDRTLLSTRRCVRPEASMKSSQPPLFPAAWSRGGRCRHHIKNQKIGTSVLVMVLCVPTVVIAFVVALILAVANVKSTVKAVDPRTGWVFVVGIGAYLLAHRHLADRLFARSDPWINTLIVVGVCLLWRSGWPVWDRFKQWPQLPTS